MTSSDVLYIWRQFIIQLCGTISYTILQAIFVVVFCSKIVLFSCHPVVGMSLYILPLIAGRIFFSLFRNVLFCLYCFTLFEYLFVFLLSPVPSGLSPRVSLSVLLELFYLLSYVCVSSRISYPSLISVGLFFMGTPIFHRLILLVRIN